jgi:hypothetical protein
MSPGDNNPGLSGGSSGAGFQVSKSSQPSSTSNVHFSDSESPWHYEISSNLDETYQTGGTHDADLGSFLNRPLNIATYQWTPSSQLFETFNPWALYFNNADVLQKINRFRNLRCSMCIKVMLNGNSFYYGRALLSYNPYTVNDDVTLNRAFFEQDLVGASQKPHVLLDPCSSQGAEMCLPFIYPENWFDITRPNWTDELGLCTIHDFHVLQHANGGTDPISVNIFAWCENVEMCIPTALEAQSGSADVQLDECGYPVVVYQAQGGPKKSKAKKRLTNATTDEFQKRDGLISKPASAIASAANALTMIPFISPYAKATSMVAEKVGQVARLFGYSRPNNLKDTEVIVPHYLGNLCNTDTTENLIKLSVDSKNELTIDSRVTGMNGADELTINSIASRETYFTQFDWPESATSGDHLFSVQADPMIVRTLVALPVTEIHQTALSFATSPFAFWQGTLKFRFQIVCSEYHRGRLRIVYDPNQNTDNAFNLAYSTVIDITEDRDIEYEVKWTQPRAWQSVLPMSVAAYFPRFTTDSAPPAVNTDYNNGQLSIYVVNDLATPSITPADVKVLCWVSAGDDFAVAAPSGNINTLSYFKQQAEWEVYDAQAGDETAVDIDNPIEAPSVPAFGGSMIPDDNQYLVYQGERIVSFRDLMRRYYYHSSLLNFNMFPNGGSPNSGMRTFLIQNYPKYYGWDPDGSDVAVASTAAPTAFNYARVPLFQYLAPAFVCRRGAMRVKYAFNARHESDICQNGYLSLAMGEGQNATSFVDFAALVEGYTNDSGVKAALVEKITTTSGGIVTPLSLNPVIEAEIPFYTRGQRFIPARDLKWNTGRDHFGRHVLSTFTDTSNTQDISRWDAFWSVGEDFNLSFFVGAPVMHYYNYPDPT